MKAFQIGILFLIFFASSIATAFWGIIFFKVLFIRTKRMTSTAKTNDQRIKIRSFVELLPELSETGAPLTGATGLGGT